MKNESWLIYNAVIIDGTGAEEREGCSVFIEGGRIRGIVENEKAGAFHDCSVIDGTGKYLLPGLIDAHIHLSGLTGDRISAYTLDPNIRLLRSAYQAKEVLSYGITSVRDISWQGLFLKRMFHNGELSGPRIVACGPGLSRTGGHGDVNELPLDYTAGRSAGSMADFADTPEEIIKAVRSHLRYGADQIKFWATGGGYSSVDKDTDCHYSYNEIRLIIEEAKKIGQVRTCAHAENLQSIRDCVEAGVDSIEHGETLDEETAEKMAEKGIILVPTLKLVAGWLIDRYGKASPPPPVAVKYGPFMTADLFGQKEANPIAAKNAVYDSFKLAKEKGVKIAVGSDCVFDTTSKYGEYTIMELLTLKDAGMTPLEALRAGTETAAEALGLKQYIGTIESGKTADLLLLRKNPAESLEVLLDKANIELIMQNGAITMEEGKFVF